MLWPIGTRTGLATLEALGTTTPARRLNAGLVLGRAKRLWNAAPARGSLNPIQGVPLRLPDGTLGGVPLPKPYRWDGLLNAGPIPSGLNINQMAQVRERMRADVRKKIYARYKSRPVIPPGPGAFEWALSLRIKPRWPSAVRGSLRDIAPRMIVDDTTYGRDTTPYSVTRSIIRQERGLTMTEPAVPISKSVLPAALGVSRAQEIQRTVIRGSVEPAVTPEPEKLKTERLLYLGAALVALFWIVRGR
jgi:hypothetical protein